MKRQVSLLIVGAGGYGNNYLKSIFNNINENETRFKIEGIVEPNPAGCNYTEELKQFKVPFYKTIEEFYAVHNADLAVISSPIQFHSYQSCYALEHGSNVLCEKPICAAIQDAFKMIESVNNSGRFLAVGYQWSYEDSVLDLKKDIIAGKFGRPKRLKTIVLWPRSKKYFSRNSWAGKIRDNNGNWVLDSIANNAAAHYLHNMFFILGDRLDGSACPSFVRAELYRANDIESFDTAVIQAFTRDNVEILFYATHAVKNFKGPVFHYEFENGTVEFNADLGEDRAIIARFSDGSEKVYGKPSAYMKKLWVCIDAASAGVSDTITCKAETAVPQLLCINGAHASMPEIANFPGDLIREDIENELIWVHNLDELLYECYENEELLSNRKISWTKSGKEIDLTNYRIFTL